MAKLPIKCYNWFKQRGNKYLKKKCGGEVLASNMPGNMTLEEAVKRIDQLEAANAALKGAGKINREVKNSVFLDMFRRKEYLAQMCRSLQAGAFRGCYRQEIWRRIPRDVRFFR